jgi:hypothetical protein
VGTRRKPSAEGATAGTSATVAIGSPSDGHDGAFDPQRLSRSVELALRLVDERSGAAVVVSKIRCRGFGVDGEALFASLGFDAAKAGTTRQRTKPGVGAEMAGGRIPRDSRVGTTG